MAWPLNHIATIDLRAASVGNYNRANIRGHAPATALGSSVSSSWAFFPAGRPSPRRVNRARAAKVAPGPVYLPLSIFFPRAWPLSPGKKPRQQFQSSAPRRYLARGGPFLRAWSTPPGKWQWRDRKRGDFSDLMCGRRFRSALSAMSAGEQRDGAAADVALRPISSPRLRAPAREVDAGGEITRASPPRQQRRPIISMPPVCVAPVWKMLPGA